MFGAHLSALWKARRYEEPGTYPSVGAAICILRQQTGMDFEKLSFYTGVPKTVLRHIEGGQKASRATLAALAEVAIDFSFPVMYKYFRQEEGKIRLKRPKGREIDAYPEGLPK